MPWPRFSGAAEKDPLSTTGCFSAWLESNAAVFDMIPPDAGVYKRNLLVSLLDHPAKEFVSGLAAEERDDLQVLITRLKQEYRPRLVSDALVNYVSSNLKMDEETQFSGFLVRFKNACAMLVRYADVPPMSDATKVARLYDCLPLSYRMRLGNVFQRKRLNDYDPRVTLDCSFKRLCEECELYHADCQLLKRQEKESSRLAGRSGGFQTTRRQMGGAAPGGNSGYTAPPVKDGTSGGQQTKQTFRCPFHKSNAHDGADCRAQQRQVGIKTLERACRNLTGIAPQIASLLSETEPTDFPEYVGEDDGGEDDLGGGVDEPPTIDDIQQCARRSQPTDATTPVFPKGGLF
jgi:hypothetical protein